MAKKYPEQAKRVQEVLNECPYTDREIASMVGKSEATIYRWRTGQTKQFDPNTLKSIASNLKVNIEWLRFGEGEKDAETNNQVSGLSAQEVLHAREVEVPKGGLSQEQIIGILEQIEQMTRLIRENLGRTTSRPTDKENRDP